LVGRNQATWKTERGFIVLSMVAVRLGGRGGMLIAKPRGGSSPPYQPATNAAFPD
jgi:hypothetical protein